MVLERLETLYSLQIMSWKMYSLRRYRMDLNCPPQQQMIHTLKPGWLPVESDLVSSEPSPSWLWWAPRASALLPGLRGLRDSLPDFQYPWLHTSQLTWGQWDLWGTVYRSWRRASSLSLTKVASVAWRTFPSLAWSPLPLAREHFFEGLFSFFFYSFGEHSCYAVNSK